MQYYINTYFTNDSPVTKKDQHMPHWHGEIPTSKPPLDSHRFIIPKSNYEAQPRFPLFLLSWKQYKPKSLAKKRS